MKTWDQAAASLFFTKDAYCGTGYFSKVKKYREIGYMPVSIARFAPKSVDLPSIGLLMPPIDLLNAYKGGKVDKNSYVKWYIDKVLNNLSCEQILNSIFAKYKKPVFICYEKPFDLCHRHLVSNWIMENTGIICGEIQA